MDHYLKIKEWLYSQEPKLYTIKQGKYSNNYWDLKCGFDIETTTYIDRAYMYIWQIGINNKAFYGNTWEEFNDCLDIINKYIYSINPVFIRLYVHLLAYYLFALAALIAACAAILLATHVPYTMGQLSILD